MVNVGYYPKLVVNYAELWLTTYPTWKDMMIWSGIEPGNHGDSAISSQQKWGLTREKGILPGKHVHFRQRKWWFTFIRKTWCWNRHRCHVVCPAKMTFDDQLEWSFTANNIAFAKHDKHQTRGSARLLSIDPDNSAWFKPCQGTRQVWQFDLHIPSEIPCLTVGSFAKRSVFVFPTTMATSGTDLLEVYLPYNVGIFQAY